MPINSRWVKGDRPAADHRIACRVLFGFKDRFCLPHQQDWGSERYEVHPARSTALPTLRTCRDRRGMPLEGATLGLLDAPNSTEN